MWGQIERFARASAKRADTIGTFLESFKRKMSCETINPKWCVSTSVGFNAIIRDDGTIEQYGSDERRNFLTEIIESGNDQHIIETIYRETGRAIMLVRERLEREKPIEKRLEEIVEGEIVQ